MVSKFKSERERASRIWKSTVVDISIPPSFLSNLFQCVCHVSPLSKTPQTSLFFNPIKYILTSFYTHSIICFFQSTFFRWTSNLIFTATQFRKEEILQKRDGLRIIPKLFTGTHTPTITLTTISLSNTKIIDQFDMATITDYIPPTIITTLSSLTLLRCYR